MIHAWAMPPFALKVDAVPGRLNQLWFKVDQPGIYYGQCSELCGKTTATCRSNCRILPEDQYNQWLTRLKTSADEANAYLDQVQPRGAAQVAAAQ